MSEQYKEKGEQILEALAMAGKKQSLLDEIKQQNNRISDNNNSVAELKASADADNANASESIKGLTQELEGLTQELDSKVESLKKEGYALPIGSKKSKIVSL